MKGHSIAGTSECRKRVENDYYATPVSSTEALLQKEEILYPVWEPACGEGHIASLLYDLSDQSKAVYASDLVDRDYGETGIDFLKQTDNLATVIYGDFFEKQPFKTIITNPPFNLFQEFAEHALKLATHKVILFGKLQALEGKKRGTFMQNSPLKTVYVFKSRQNPLRNGSPVDENGKPWASTMAFAWYVWEIGYTGEPIIKWLE